MHVIDLSHTIHDDIQIYPGDPVPAIRRGLTHEEDFCPVDTLQLGSHTGTHIDAPYHFLKEGDTIDRIPVERFVGYGVLIDVSAKADNEMIAPDDVEPYGGQIRKGNFAIFRTGWDRYFGTPRYFQHPFLSADGARLLLNLGVSVVAIDAMSVDPSSSDAVIGGPATKDKDRKPGTGHPAHEVLLGNDILIVENLCGLERVKAVKGMYCFLPLKLKGSDGSPIRAVFVMS